MTVVHDIHRPDVNDEGKAGFPLTAKMAGIREQVEKELQGLLPYLNITCDDNIMSSVTVRGSLQPRQDWANGILQNSPYFIVNIKPARGLRYYVSGSEVTLEMLCSGSGVAKLRKYTANPDKVIAKLKAWVKSL